MVPAIGLGTAPAGHLPEKEAVALYHACLDAGVTYLDTAPALGGYGDAQRFLAPVLKERRDQAFVVTKCFEPDGEKALALLKKNLKELGIDRADLVYAHSIGADEMPPEKVFGKAGVCAALTKAKRDGLTRFVGVSGHNRPARFLRALEEWEYDVQMNAVGLVARHTYDFEGKVWPAAAKKGIGLAAMKVFGGAAGGKDWSARLPEELRPAAFRYALGLPGVAVVVLGMKSQDELKQNLEWLKGVQAADGRTSWPPWRGRPRSWRRSGGPSTGRSADPPVSGRRRVPDVQSVVVDTNLFVAAGFNPASDAARILAAVRAGTLRLVWDEATRRETEHVVRTIPPLSGTDLLNLFLPEGQYEGPTYPEQFDSVPDPSDRKFAALAAATGAVLLTRDRHLLAGRPQPGVVILTPGEFAEQLDWGDRGQTG